MKPNKIIKFIVIGFIAGLFLSLFLWERFLSSDEVIEVRYDSLIYQFDSIEVPEPYKVTKYVHTRSIDTLILNDTIKLYDTITIVQEFKNKRFYNDTLRDDQLVAYLAEEVQFNRIVDRDFSYKILRPTEIIQPNPNSFYIGSYVYNAGIIPYAQFNRNKWSVSVGIDPFEKRIIAGAGYKIK